MAAPRDSARSRDQRTRWVPVSELSALARALLSDDLGGRDCVPGHVADRVNAQARQWAAHGFTEHTVRPWQDAPPAAAAYLAERGVDPAVLDLPIEAFPGTAPVTLRMAITCGRLPVERAYDLLVLTGQHRPAQPGAAPSPAGPSPATGQPDQGPAGAPGAGEPASAAGQPTRRTPAGGVPPVIFSHAVPGG